MTEKFKCPKCGAEEFEIRGTSINRFSRSCLVFVDGEIDPDGDTYDEDLGDTIYDHTVECVCGEVYEPRVIAGKLPLPIEKIMSQVDTMSDFVSVIDPCEIVDGKEGFSVSATVWVPKEDVGIPMERCKFCDEQDELAVMHPHDEGYVCPECWDERLRATE